LSRHRLTSSSSSFVLKYLLGNPAGVVLHQFRNSGPTGVFLAFGTM